jgi:type VI secretion system protein ImpH
MLCGALAEPENGIEVEQCAARRATIPDDQRLRLGVCGNRLGQDTYVGRWVVDRRGAFSVGIGPLDSPQLQRYLPGSEGLRVVAEQVRFYVDQPLDWDVRVQVRTRGMATVQLGSAGSAQLGWNTWVFTGTMAGTCVAARFRPQ